MLRVILVDDDVVVRTNLKTMIEWEAYGFLIAGEAANGEECLKKLKEEPYDLVITDMSMPVMGGVPLIETMNRLYPDCEIIAISGYDDFDYVSNSTLYIHQQLTSLVSRINITARKYMGFQVNIALSRVCDGFERIPEAYARA